MKSFRWVLIWVLIELATAGFLAVREECSGGVLITEASYVR